ncbi:MAG: RnfABCDGE type electron transport complex subunit D [Acholeplasmataceae bacterium]
MNDSFDPAIYEATRKRNMFVVAGFLFVLLLISAYFFTYYVLLIALVSYASAFVVEYVFVRVRKLKLDYGLLVSPLIFTMLMPPSAPLWMVAVGSGFGMFFGKCIFGGLGRNIFNPALVGALFVTISFPELMTTQWLMPLTDQLAGATPIVSLQSGDFAYTLNDLLFGRGPGALGETFRIGVIVFGLMLVLFRIADWRIPLSYLGSVLLIALVGNLIDSTTFQDPVLTLFVGGLMFAAFFVATDPVTAPISSKGKVIYGIGLGIFTIIIRNFAAFPEGITFSVIIMNALVPLIDPQEQPIRPKEEVPA